MNQRLLRMVGHGAIITFIGMLAGIGLLIALLGGIEPVPGHIIHFNFPGTSAAWVRVHIGCMLNGMMIILIALLVHAMALKENVERQLKWMLVGTGYANSLFYFAALFAPNRALSFAPNRFGDTNLAAVIGLTPALIFVFISLIAFFIIIKQAFSMAAAKKPS